MGLGLWLRNDFELGTVIGNSIISHGRWPVGGRSHGATPEALPHVVQRGLSRLGCFFLGGFRRD